MFVRPQLDHAASILGAPVKLRAGARKSARSRRRAAEAGSRPQRLTEILKSEPATEALLLTQVVANDMVEEEGEIITAHAKPVARFDFEAARSRRAAAERRSPRRRAGSLPPASRTIAATAAQSIAACAQCASAPQLQAARSFAEPRPRRAHAASASACSPLGVSLLIDGGGDVAEFAGAAALGTPGLAAVLMAAFGFWRAPKPTPVAAEA